jgi:hypothetical protein
MSIVVVSDLHAFLCLVAICFTAGAFPLTLEVAQRFARTPYSQLTCYLPWVSIFATLALMLHIISIYILGVSIHYVAELALAITGVLVLGATIRVLRRG